MGHYRSEMVRHKQFYCWIQYKKRQTLRELSVEAGKYSHDTAATSFIKDAYLRGKPLRDQIKIEGTSVVCVLQKGHKRHKTFDVEVILTQHGEYKQSVYAYGRDE